jgi:hypothetical protein
MSKIIGNTTATPNPRPDWNQSDETKADYIKNKPVLHTHNDNLEVLDNLGENSVGELTYKDKTVGTPSPHIVERNLDDIEACARVYTQNVITIEADLPENSRVKKIEIFDPEIVSNEYVNLEDLTKFDVIGEEVPYSFIFPKNKFGTMLPVAAHIWFPFGTNNFYDLVMGTNLTGKIKIYYEIEEE